MSWWEGFGSILGGLVGGGLNYYSQQKANEENIKFQREFAQNGLSWKVEDARRAGVHPLAALGASGYQAAPSSVGADIGSPIGNGISAATSKIAQALDEDAKKMSELQIQNQELENVKLAKEIAGMGQSIASSAALPYYQSFNTPPNSEILGIGVTPNSEAQQLANLVNASYDVGKRWEIRPIDKNSFMRSFAPDSLEGNSYEGITSMIPAVMSQFWDEIVNSPLSDFEKVLRSKGALAKDECLFKTPGIYGWTYTKYKCKSPPPPKNFKYNKKLPRFVTDGSGVL